MKLLMICAVLSLGLSAHAEDLSLVFHKTPPPVRDTDCETVTDLSKQTVVGRSGGMVTFITLSNRIVGDCEKHVDSTPRVYVVDKEETVCGSKSYQASQEGTQETLTLVDHRKRVCLDVVPALFILMQAHPQKRYAPLYGEMLRVPRPDIPYHPGPEMEITDGNAMARALINNPNIGETLRHNNMTNVSRMTRQGIRPGVTRYVVEFIASGLRGPGKAVVVIVEDMRPTYADGAIKYEVSIDILE